MPSIFGSEEHEHAQVWEGAGGWQSPMWHIHTMYHLFLFCSHDLWPSKRLKLHTLSFVRHYLILQREVYKFLAGLCTELCLLFPLDSVFIFDHVSCKHMQKREKNMIPGNILMG